MRINLDKLAVSSDMQSEIPSGVSFFRLHGLKLVFIVVSVIAVLGFLSFKTVSGVSDITHGDLLVSPSVEALAFVTATNTPVPLPTNTALLIATNTSLPTNTALPTATNTPVPLPTNTALPIATNTSVPTNTPVPIPTATPFFGFEALPDNFSPGWCVMVAVPAVYSSAGDRFPSADDGWVYLSADILNQPVTLEFKGWYYSYMFFDCGRYVPSAFLGGVGLPDKEITANVSD